FLSFAFFFQAEDGIRDLTVTGVQTCALPICRFLLQLCCRRFGCSRLDEKAVIGAAVYAVDVWFSFLPYNNTSQQLLGLDCPKRKIGRASCRERVEIAVDEG